MSARQLEFKNGFCCACFKTTQVAAGLCRKCCAQHYKTLSWTGVQPPELVTQAAAPEPPAPEQVSASHAWAKAKAVWNPRI